MSDDCIASPSSRQSASDLLRSASETIGVGTAALPNEGENLIVRRPSSRQTDDAERMDALARELIQSLPRRVYLYFGIIGCSALFILMGMVFFWVRATNATLLNMLNDKPCDQSGLKVYMLFTCVPGILSRRIMPKIRNFLIPQDHPNLGMQILTTILLTDVPAWLVIMWGMYMVSSSKTCSETNPEIFYATRNYLHFQIIFCCLSVAICVAFALGLRHFILILGRLHGGKGCKEAVSKLPTVSNNDSQLIDPEDGETMHCPICMESFAFVKTVVRTPCQHYFHECCLSNWCSNHLDCPLCRQPVGEPCP